MTFEIGMTVTRISPTGENATFTINNEKEVAYHTELKEGGYLYKDDNDWLEAAKPQVRVHAKMNGDGTNSKMCVGACEG